MCTEACSDSSDRCEISPQLYEYQSDRSIAASFNFGCGKTMVFNDTSGAFCCSVDSGLWLFSLENDVKAGDNCVENKEGLSLIDSVYVLTMVLSVCFLVGVFYVSCVRLRRKHKQDPNSVATEESRAEAVPVDTQDTEENTSDTDEDTSPKYLHAYNFGTLQPEDL